MFTAKNLLLAICALSPLPVFSQAEEVRCAEIAPDVLIELLPVGPGSFVMGSPQCEPGHREDECAHNVTISEAFWLGRCEVTQRQWELVMGGNPSRFGTDSPNQPVDSVTWDEAMEFCRRLTATERAAGRIGSDWEYTLPTEAQWEYACRAGTQAVFSFGDDPAALCIYGNYSDRSNTDLFDNQDLRHSDGFDRTAPVGCFRPNMWGFRDMHGNVWEWCRDWYGPYGKCPQTDPAGPETGSVHVDRGGAWNDSADMCRSARRLHDGMRQPCAVGLRVALCKVGGDAR